MKVPGWLLFVIALATVFNAIVAITIVCFLWRPELTFGPMTSDAALGLHLQLFEAILAAIGISLAVFGFVGFNAVRTAAERRASETAREVADRILRGERGGSVGGEPDTHGYDPTQVTREEEKDDL